MKTIDTPYGKMVLIKGGTFIQQFNGEKVIKCSWDEYPNGDHRRKPIHHPAICESFVYKRQVTLSDFWITENPITIKQWEEYMGDPGRTADKTNPINHISWSDIQCFIRRMEYPIYTFFGLPSSAQLEYLASKHREMILDGGEFSCDATICKFGTEAAVIDPREERGCPTRVYAVYKNGNKVEQMADYSIYEHGFHLILKKSAELEFLKQNIVNDQKIVRQAVEETTSAANKLSADTLNKLGEIKLSAEYGIWKAIRTVDNKSLIYKNGQLCDKASPALRDIAQEIGFTIDPEWRTSQLCVNVIKAMQKAK